MAPIDYTKKTIVFVTGASRGIGRSIALEISRKLDQQSIIVLMARSESGLTETKAQIAEVDKTITVQTYRTDFLNPRTETFEDVFNRVLNSADTKDIQNAIIFHNAGHVGTVKKSTDLSDLVAWREHFDVNLFSLALLNSVFMKRMRPIAQKLCVVNISSLAGRVPVTNLAMYGSGKAARDLFFKVLSIEEPDVVVLNYSPGPVDTDMFDMVLKTAQSEDLKKNFEEVKKTTVLLPPVTVNKMLDLLEKGEFKNGDTVDYYDRI
ncbi:unnamed protein product [Phyllotreta striolata]|uniref:Sepiapterin reductase n=1 Tax=Phyllotreta striolata TaxID=444603 RepID=A0A9N9XQE1_PHYSR|nr:unnamed protein product [Phyllotreta striolata]